MKKNNILPTIDLQNSREYSGAYNSRDFYKGTSFKMAGEWITNTHYFNDEYIVDFVSFEGALLSCIRSHTSSSLNMPELVRENDKIIGIKPNLFWAFVMAGVEGPVGKVWVPEVKNGIISWKESNTSPSSTPIENLKGEPGDTPIVGIKKDTLNNTYYWTVSINGESPRWILDENGQKISAQGLKGDPGKNGTDGKPGKNGADGITPEFKIENDYWFVSYDNGTNWTQLGKAKGDRGATGEKGKDAIQPKFRISLGNWEVSYDKGINWEKVGRATGSKGDPGKDGVDGRAGKDGKDGITPEFKIVNNNWYITYDEGISWKLLGRAIGDQGEPGKTPALVRKFGDPDNLTDDRILWGYLGDPTSEWVTLCYLEELRGDSIKSVNISDAEGHLELTMESSKVITSTGSVLPRFNAGTIETVEWDQRPSLVIDKTNAPREWALNVKVPKGKPATVTVVSEVEKLAPDAQPYVTDLNPDISDANLKFGIPQGEKGDPGDENIAIGCQSDFPNNEPEHDKIWYDPCDEAMDEYSVQDFLYHSYIAIGGTLTQEQFETAWKSFPNTSASGSYESSLDPSVATVEKLGGINAGTTVAQLTGKSYDEIFDTLIFPTVNPTFVAPTATISLKGYSNTQEVGANAPTAANFNTGFNQGQILVAGKEQAKRAGALDPENSYILYGPSQELPAKVVKGSMSYKYHAAHAQGPQPKDSKGNDYGTPLAAGSVDSSAVTVTGYIPAYSGLVSTASITEDVIKGLTKTTSAKKTIKVSGPISEQYICFAAPAGWAVSNIKDSNNFDVTSSYTTSTVSVTGLDGQAVDYTVYLSGKMTQPSTYYVNFN